MGKNFTEIYPLGYKNYSEGGPDKMDASDRDGGMLYTSHSKSQYTTTQYKFK